VSPLCVPERAGDDLSLDKRSWLAEGWMFSSSAGPLRVPNSLYKACPVRVEQAGQTRCVSADGLAAASQGLQSYKLEFDFRLAT
jgi:hypothetical protein